MVGNKSLSLSQLFEQCRQGDDRAWRDLLDRLAPMIFSICGNARLTMEESFDVFGQVCYQLVRNASQVRSASRLFSYVATITRRQISDMCRKDRRLDFVDANELDQRPATEPRLADRELDRGIQQLMLWQALGSLSERDYRLLTALFFDENEPTYEEISAQLGIPVASIGPTRARALKKLRRTLERMGYDFGVF